MSNDKLYRIECSELITEYPFFRDGMTCEQFEKEQILFCEYMNNGGKSVEYVPSFERNEWFLLKQTEDLDEFDGNYVDINAHVPDVLYNYTAMAQYMRENNKEFDQMTREEIEQFRTN